MDVVASSLALCLLTLSPFILIASHFSQIHFLTDNEEFGGLRGNLKNIETDLDFCGCIPLANSKVEWMDVRYGLHAFAIVRFFDAKSTRNIENKSTIILKIMKSVRRKQWTWPRKIKLWRKRSPVQKYFDINNCPVWRMKPWWFHFTYALSKLGPLDSAQDTATTEYPKVPDPRRF
jgi:hypothetical protein